MILSLGAKGGVLLGESLSQGGNKKLEIPTPAVQ